MNINYAKFQKRFIVGQFDGNYLKSGLRIKSEKNHTDFEVLLLKRSNLKTSLSANG